MAGARWYKVFGYPTGAGCLIARREALARLRRPWFAGGSVSIASVQGGWHTPARHEARFEDGTVSFLQIPDLACGLSWVSGIGMDLIHQRVMCLTGWLLGRLAALRHGNGQPMAQIYGPASTRDRGGTVAFNLLDPGGRVIDERAVARDSAAAGISIRTGCFCNPGAGEGAFHLTKADWRNPARGRARTLDQHVDLLGLPSGGALRASVGLASTVEDAERFRAFVEDNLPRPPRRHHRPHAQAGLLATGRIGPRHASAHATPARLTGRARSPATRQTTPGSHVADTPKRA